MSKKNLFALWGFLYILCAGLGFIPEPAGFLRIGMTLLAILFFVPGAVLLARAKKKKDRAAAALIRNLSVASLGLTLLVLVLNLLCFMAPAAVGDGLHAVLVIVSSPMICGGNWLLSLFFWACLLVVSLDILRKK